MSRDLACGLAALALASIYYAAAAALPTSMLADEVGADGVPKLLAVALGALGLLLAARAVLRWTAMPADAGEAAVVRMAAHWRALGLLSIGIAYAIATPYSGYLLTTMVFVFAVAVYAGLAPSLRLLAISVAGSVGLWLTFAKVLGIAMPAGIFARLLG